MSKRYRLADLALSTCRHVDGHPEPLMRPTVRQILHSLIALATLVSTIALTASNPAHAQADIEWTITDYGSLETNAIIPRLSGAESAFTAVSGTAPGADRVRSRTLLNDTLVRSSEAAVAADGAFAVEIEVPAVTSNHTVTIELLANGDWTPIHSVDGVVGGDLYVIQGQSNAVAAVFGGGQGLQGLASPWIRSFGSSARSSVPGAHQWTTAVAATSYGFGSIGQWGMRLGADLLAANGVPVAIINGADGGKPASFFQRNDQDPTNPATNYGRLLQRLEAAGVTDSVQAIGWYQGESDWNRPTEHADFVNLLFDDWADDFASLELIHLIQIHNGCVSRGNPTGDLAVRDIQRQIAAERPEVQLVSTAALPGHDGCHYLPAGYSQLGEQIALLTQRDIIGTQVPPGVDSPTAVSARLIGADRTTLRVEFSPGDAEIIVPSTQDFLISDALVDITSAQGGVGFIDIVLDARPAAGTTFGYLGVNGPHPITAWGAGLTALTDLPIDTGPDPASPDCDGDFDLADAVAMAQLVSGVRIDSEGCAAGIAANEAHADAGDTNRDQQTDEADIQLLLACIAGFSDDVCPVA